MANTPNIYTPKEAASHIGVTTQSIRRYCDRFAKFLSPDASPSPGATRTLTVEDVYILDQVYRGTQRGWTYDQIEEELQSLTLPDHVDLAPQKDEQPPAIPEGLALLQQMANNLQSTQDALHILTRHQADVDALRKRVEALSVPQDNTNQKEHTEALDRHTIALERFATAISAFGAALLIIALLTVAVAVGWI